MIALCEIRAGHEGKRFLPVPLNGEGHAAQPQGFGETQTKVLLLQAQKGQQGAQLLPRQVFHLDVEPEIGPFGNPACYRTVLAGALLLPGGLPILRKDGHFGPLMLIPVTISFLSVCKMRQRVVQVHLTPPKFFADSISSILFT